MSLHTRARRTLPPIGVELGLVTGVLAVLYLWRRLLRAVPPIGADATTQGLLFAGAVHGGLLLGGLVAVVGAYAAARSVDTGVALPSVDDLSRIGIAMLTPLSLVALTALVGSATGVRYGSLTRTAVAADPPLTPVLIVTGLGLLVGVPALAVVCQVLVQGSFARIVDSGTAVLLTTALTAFLTVSDTGSLTAIPDLGRLVGTAVFVALLGGGALFARRIDRRRVRLLAFLPVAAFGLFLVGTGITGIDSVAAGLFAATRLATLGVAAWSYDRTGSLLVPALAYASLLSADRVVVVAFEAGLGM